MKAFVLDCSVAMAWCFSEEANVQSDQILASLKEVRAVVPIIWPLEVINVLGVSERKNRIAPAQSNMFLSLLNALPIEIDAIGDNILNKHILKLVRKHSITSYDTAYLELAERNQIPLASFDKILCKAAKKIGIELLLE